VFTFTGTDFRAGDAYNVVYLAPGEAETQTAANFVDATHLTFPLPASALDTAGPIAVFLVVNDDENNAIDGGQITVA
jgi:hypothetical protein